MHIPEGCQVSTFADLRDKIDVEILKSVHSRRTASIDEVHADVGLIIESWGWKRTYDVVLSRIHILRNRRLLLYFGGGSVERKYQLNPTVLREVKGDE
jgi:hypothetical protein